MTELICNTIQLIITGICSCISLLFAYRSGKRIWILLALFSGIFFLGDLYWNLMLVFYYDTPHFTYVSDLSWDAAYIFLLLLLNQIRGERITPFSILGKWHGLWIIPIFAFGMCIFFMQWGDYVNNVVTAFLMTGLMLYSCEGLLSIRDGHEQIRRFKSLYIAALVFCLIEYCLWIFSCYWMGDTISNPYFWFDILLSCSFVLFLAALYKGVKE